MNKYSDKSTSVTIKTSVEAQDSSLATAGSRLGQVFPRLIVFVETLIALFRQVSFKGVVITCMLLLLLVLSAVGVVYSSHLSRQLFAEQAILLERNDQLQLEWAQLLLEQSAWSSPSRIEDVAHQDLNMKIPETEEIQLIY